MHMAAGQMPEVYRDQNGRPYLRTRGGAKVQVLQDQAGNLFMVDPAGNLYYDSGDKRIGMYLVRIFAAGV